MSHLNIPSSATLMAGVLACAAATTANAQAAPETADEVVAIMQACTVFTAAHDYDATGQEIVVPWLRLGSFSASLGDQKSPVLVSAQVRGSGNSGNSYCSFSFTDDALALAAFEQFMTDKTPVIFDEKEGLCVGDVFVTIEVSGADGALAQAMKVDGFINVQNSPKFEGDPCAE